MISVITWAILFSITTTISIILLGHRELIAGEIGFVRLIHIIFDWHFIVGALFAFGSRLLFVMTNNAIYKIPEYANSSTTITTLINSTAVLLVIIANHYFLDEHLNLVQIIGAVLIIVGIFLITKV
jgi:drug/metabolite transporter (DMT)-like permease